MKLKWIVILFVIIYTAGLLLFLRSKSAFSKDHNAFFVSLPRDSTGIDFANNISTSDSLNIFTYEYLYNGAGVGIGDFNNDGLPDLFFNASQLSPKIYTNKGNFRFEDITETSGIKIEKGWPFGVSIEDINQDGLPDIYLSIGGPGNKDVYPNKLFINQGADKNNKPYFREMAKEYGLADSGQSIQSAFLDFDHDGDLDMYLLTGGGFERSPIVPHPIAKDGSARNTDRLYRNDFDNTLGHPVFTNVSKQAGILEEGFGLGVTVFDINDDGWQDIYVTNDYLTNDQLYINKHDGTFAERTQDYFKHTSHFAMGNDIGDINNDGLPDIIAVDMLPDDHYQRTLMFGPNQYDKFHYSVNQGYSYQYMRNTLQLNRGNGKFSEIGQLAGIYKTSWSWASLFADLDNDGYQDIFITNGFGKNITDLDFVKYRADISRAEGGKSVLKKLIDGLSELKGIQSHPYAYRNNGDLTFTDKSKSWGFNKPVYSNGAAYADLDRDGDLDIITNNNDGAAGIYRNKIMESARTGTANYLRIKLKGTEYNQSGSGTRITLKYNDQVQTRWNNSVRGFESTVEPVVHFGLGAQTVVDSIIVTWPDGKISRLSNIKTNQVLTVDYTSVNVEIFRKTSTDRNTLFTEVDPKTLNITYKNKPNDFQEFNYERLLPRKYSQGGPSVAVGDVNGDGLEDFFVGGAYQQSGEVYFQNKNGKFSSKTLTNPNDYSEDAGSLLFDADADGDLDLYVVSGGNEYTDKNIHYQHRLYKNDGKGNLTNDKSSLPVMRSSGSCVVAADFEGDGDLDLFVGGAVVPGMYPLAPTSYLLQNNNGKFTDVTDAVSPALRKIGMVSSALWTDIDQNGKPDLMVVGEWMPISIFMNQNGKLINITNEAGLKDTEGWWQSMVSGDFDNDGDMDYVVGNWGVNYPHKASVEEPMGICYKDFDKNGSVDPVLCYYEDGENYPAPGLDFIIDQIPSLRKKRLNYASYASTTMEKLLSILGREGVQSLYCKTLFSSYLQNDGNGKFTVKKLPTEAQFSPIYGMLSEDINYDGNLDLISVGNFYGTEVVTGRYDASVGLVMYGNGKGGFIPVNISESGLLADKDSKAIGRIESADNTSLLLVTQTSDSIKVFKEDRSQKLKRVIPVQNEISAMIYFKGGFKRKMELGFGTSYLSQSSRNIILTDNIKRIELFNGSGVKTREFNY